MWARWPTTCQRRRGERRLSNPKAGPLSRRCESGASLLEHFSNDVMSLEEFEALLDAVNRCSTTGELREILRTLPPLESSKPATDMIPARGGAPVVVDADRVRDHGFLISVLSGTNRSGCWIPARSNFAIGVLGGLSLDFREALLGPGETDLNLLAVLGGVEIIVPPEMAVEVDGMALLGGFEHQTDNAAPDQSGCPDATGPRTRTPRWRGDPSSASEGDPPGRPKDDAVWNGGASG